MRRAVGTGQQRGASRRRPGPTPGLANPHPIGDGIDEPKINWIAPGILDDSERRLRRYFRERRGDLVPRPRESADRAVQRISDLARKGLEETGAAWWSGLEGDFLEEVRWKTSPPWLWAESAKKYLRFWAAPQVGPTPPTKRAAHGLPWLDTSTTPNIMRYWDRPTKTWAPMLAVSEEFARHGDILRWGWEMTQPADWFSPSWYRVRGSRLRQAAKNLLAPGGLGRAGRSGRPAYFACAVLGAILDVTPDRIIDSLNHYRRTRPRPSKK
jgi:hypothetical protein